ncbi:MAG: LamG domain-containing protein [Saprospiraceae bacterium]|nr:LamG domain-containing protein [Saprospiraceae bacterium]
MSAIDSKYHLKIEDFGFMLAKQARVERHIYTREEAPYFVNKFSSGDPNYRDATFFPHWAQLNWLNGFDQEFFDDGGKFFRSSAVDPTAQEKLTLQKAINSAGTVSNDGMRSFGLRSSSSSGWWSTDYEYRRKITITAGSSAVPEGYPVKLTEDSDAIETAGNVRSDRKDWRIIYSDGTSDTDLTRDYVDADLTVFSTQVSIAAEAEDDSYYLYYGYSSESTDKEPTDDDGWNEVYTPPDTDANVLGLWHNKEGTGTSVEDTSGNGNDATLNGSVTWTASDSKFGWALDFPGNSGAYMETPAFDQDAGTIQMWIKKDSVGGGGYIFNQRQATSKWLASWTGTGGIKVGLQGDSGYPELTATSVIQDTNWHHLAFVFDGTDQVYIYLDGSLNITLDFSNSGQTGLIRSGNSTIRFGESFAGQMSNIRFDNVTRNSFPHALSEEPSTETADEDPQGDAASGGIFEIYGADDSGVVYLWDGTSTWTEQFNVRRLKWNDDISTVDGSGLVGDDGGTEKATAQAFTLDADTRVKGVEVYLKKNAGTPGDITVRIETDDTNAPSGTLADANLTGTISSFAETDYAWITLDFDSVSTANLSDSTKYWLVLKTDAASNDNNYAWGADTSSPGYDDGDAADSTDGGSGWSADSGKDMMFRILGEATRVNEIAQAQLDGNTELWFATGDPNNTRDNNARLYIYDGTDWELRYTFTGTGTAAALCLQVYESQLFVGLSPRSKIYSTSDGSTFTESKDIDQPDNPGYPWDMEVYNQRLYVCGGHPEYSIDNYSLGYLWSYDNYAWQFVYDFSFTVAKTMEVFDGLLFIATTDKKLYVFNTASIDKLFEFPWDVTLDWMGVWDDKLAIGLNGANGLTGEEAVYLFDRNGFHKAFVPPSVGIQSGIVARNELILGTTGNTIYKVNDSVYASSGTLQSSYFEAQLPNIYKLYRSITIMYDSLPTGASILIEYRADETDSWTTLGTASTAGSTSETFNFASGVYSYKISLRYTLSTSDTSKTPTLRKSILKYVLSPDFKYMWKMKLACPDKMIWLDGAEPQAIVGTAINAEDTSIVLKSTDDASPTNGFPDPNGSAMYAVVEDSDGNEDVFTYTGKTSTTLTGIPSSGTYALSNHSVGEIVRIRGADLHQKILDLKQARQLVTFTDIDGLTYTVLFHSYQSDNWVINPEDSGGGLENEVPITLLEA